jgi:hypothetical protein
MTALEKDIDQFGRKTNLTGRERFKAWFKQITVPELRRLVEKTDSTKERKHERND